MKFRGQFTYLQISKLSPELLGYRVGELLFVPGIFCLRRLMLVALVTVSSSASVQAADAKGWDWRLTPLYYWSLNIKLNESAGGGETPTDPPVDPDPFHFNFEGAFSTNFEGVYANRWGFIFDIVWTNLSSTGTNTKLDFEYLQTELDGFYRTSFERQSVDWIIGARYYGTETELEPRPLNADESWVDPLIGVRWNWDIADTWAMSLRGDIGGFGVGSELSAQGVAVVDWHPWEHVSITGGIRALRVEYETGKGPDNYTLDLTAWGPLLGVSFRW